jgi:hypothetical protein
MVASRSARGKQFSKHRYARILPEIPASKVARLRIDPRSLAAN